MIYTTNEGRRVPVHCTRCGLSTPVLSVANEKAAAEVLLAAGWTVRSGSTLCPRCRSFPAASVPVVRRRALAPPRG
jgi:hypothetical protein